MLTTFATETFMASLAKYAHMKTCLPIYPVGFTVEETQFPAVNRQVTDKPSLYRSNQRELSGLQ